MDDVLADEGFIRHARHHHRAVFQDHDDVVDVGTLLDELFFFKTFAYETFLTVYVKLGVVGGDDGDLHFLETVEGSFALAAPAVLLQQHLVPRDGVFGQVFQVVLHLFKLLLQGGHPLVGLEFIVLGNSLDANLGEADDVVFGDGAQQFDALVSGFFLLLGVAEEFFEAGLDDVDHFGEILGLFDVAVNALLDKDLLQAGEVEFFLQFLFFDEQLHP